MKPHTLAFVLTSTYLLTSIGCSPNNSPMMATSDQAQSGPVDMGSMAMTDARDPNAPGLVRYSYICDDKPEKTVELPRVQFGATYSCGITNDIFAIEVTDNRIPVDFSLNITNYHGPGTYTIIAQQFSGSGWTDCQWSDLKVLDGNCPALHKQITPCCLNTDAQAKALTCTVTVQQHVLTRVSGVFACEVQAGSEGPNTPNWCPYFGKASVHGSFDFGPQDCK